MTFSNKTLIIKVTEHCNLDCEYCYIDDNLKQRKDTNQIQDVVLDSLLEKISLEASGSIKLIWHGGEPLLVGKEFYTGLEEKIKQLRNTGLAIDNRIQTNACLLTSDFLKILEKLNMRFGISFDGPKDLHNRLRHTRTGKGTYGAVTNAFTLLKSRGHTFGVISVITKYHLGREADLYDECKNQNINGLQLSQFKESGHGLINSDKLAISSVEFMQFLKNMYDLWIEDFNNNFMWVKPLDGLVRVAIGATPRLCTLNGCVDDFLSVSTNGNVYPCARFGSIETFSLGNILRDSLVSLTEKKLSLYNRTIQDRPGYKCPFMAFVEGGNIESLSKTATAYDSIINYIRTDLTSRLGIM